MTTHDQSDARQKVGICISAPVTSVRIQAVIAASIDLQITFCVGTSEALSRSLAQTGTPDLLIIDDLMLHEYAERGDTQHVSAMLVVSLPESDLCNVFHFAMQLGAQGYCRHSIAPSQLRTAVASLLGGAAWFEAEVLKILRERFFIQQSSGRAVVPLTAREAQVLDLMVRGLSNPQIARQLFISVPTVKVRVREILRKLNVQNRAQACAEAVRCDLT